MRTGGGEGVLSRARAIVASFISFVDFFVISSDCVVRGTQAATAPRTACDLVFSFDAFGIDSDRNW